MLIWRAQTIVFQIWREGGAPINKGQSMQKRQHLTGSKQVTGLCDARIRLTQVLEGEQCCMHDGSALGEPFRH